MFAQIVFLCWDTEIVPKFLILGGRDTGLLPEDNSVIVNVMQSGVSSGTYLLECGKAIKSSVWSWARKDGTSLL